MPGICSFNLKWLNDPTYKQWLDVVRAKKSFAKCKVCVKEFTLGTMGEQALKSHMAGKKHQAAISSLKDTRTVASVFKCPASVLDSPSPSSSASVPVPVCLDSFCSKTDVIEAEVKWALRTVSSHSSFRSNDDLDFSALFPDSAVAAKFSLGRDKTSYIVNFGLAPYFISRLKEDIRNSSGGYVLLFDESLNKQLQKSQCDIHVRAWFNGMVETRFLHSEFLGHTTAADISAVLQPTILELSSQLLQLSMDGPTVNHAVKRMLTVELKSMQPHRSLLETGTCSLHTVHNSFRAGCMATSWDLEYNILSCYYLFKDSPARRQDFITISGCKSLPPKFCKHRWLENISVMSSIIALMPSLKKYVKEVKKKPVVRSFGGVKTLIEDELFLVKAEFFISVARQMEIFLTVFQSDAPLLPFLSRRLFLLIKGLLTRFTTISVESPSDLSKIDFGNSVYLDNKDIDIGFISKKHLKIVKDNKLLSDRKIYEFYQDVKAFLKATVLKLINKTPVSMSLVRNLECLDPSFLTNHKEKAGKMFGQVLSCMVDAGLLLGRECDIILSQFKLLKHERLMLFQEPQRLDCFYSSLLSEDGLMRDLWRVLQKLLVLSHGQASVERGFSRNRQIMEDNLSEQSLVSRRIVNEAVKSVGGFSKVTITKSLLSNVAASRQRYEAFKLEKKEKEAFIASKKRKAEDNLAVEAKKLKLMAEIKHMNETADRLARESMEKSDFSILSSSLELREVAKRKEAELKEL